MRKILAICDHPKISVYAHHAYINSILQNENYVNNVLYSFSVQNYETAYWSFDGQDIELIEKDGNQILKTKKYSQNNEAFLIRDCKESDELYVKIQKWTFTQGDNVINLILTNKEFRRCCVKDSNIIRIGIVKNIGLYYKVNDDYRYVPNISANDIKAIRVKKKGENLDVFIETMEGKNVQVISDILDSRMEWHKIGINVNAGENQYDSWLFMNYVQTFYTEEDNIVCYDYYDLPERNFSHHIVNQFMVYRNENINTIYSIFGGVIPFCKWNVEHGRYIQLMLNEYYIPHRSSYEVENFLHANLIYGIDEEKEEIYILGYSEKYKLKKSAISYEIFLKAVSKNEKDIIRTMEYSPNNLTCKFELNTFLNQLKYYLSSQNPTEYQAHILPQKKGIYGILAYSRLLLTEQGRRRLFTDFRISFMICEKNLLMKDRLLFLYTRNYLKKYDYERLLGKLSVLLGLSKKLKLYAVKNRVKESKSSEDKIEEFMKTIFIVEYDFLATLISCLKKTI